MEKPERQSAGLVTLATMTLAVVVLYYGRPVLLPVALAILLSFLLSPVVDAVCRWGLSRAIAVGLVVIFMFSISSAIIWGLGRQISTLASEIPEYKDNIRQKMVDLRSAGKGGSLEKIQRTFQELSGEIQKPDSLKLQTSNLPPVIGEPSPAMVEVKPVPVVVQEGKPLAWDWPSALGPALEFVAAVFLVVVLLIFILLRRRELRNRIILLIGHARMPATTKALDEASARISRYLVMQTVVNSSFGLCVGIGLSLIGLPYALLWGFLAALLRFIPYVGPCLGASMPVLLSLAVFQGWLQPFLVIGLFAILELAVNLTIEPLLYGHTTGVSEVALLVSVAFWTWVWGPIGLALATPLTVCVVVLGKYVPSMNFIPLLMGDEPVIEPHLLLYQRMLASDKTEAAEIVEQYARSHRLSEVYDRLLIPVLIAAKRDQKSEAVSEETLAYLLDLVRTFTEKAPQWVKPNVLPQQEKRHLLLAAPSEDVFDELTLDMLKRLIYQRIDVQIISSHALSGEVMEAAENRHPDVILVSSMSPGGSMEARYLCKRFRAKFGTGLKLVLARFGSHLPSGQLQEIQAAAGADATATTLAEARNHVFQFAQLSTEEIDPTVIRPALASRDLQLNPSH